MGSPRPIAIGLAVMLLVIGCTEKAYKGPELPESEVALLHHVTQRGGVTVVGPILLPTTLYEHETFVRKIDGEPLSKGVLYHQILPGRHTVTISYTKYYDLKSCDFDEDWFYVPRCKEDYEASDLSIDFTAKAGRKYRVMVERKGTKDWIWVDEITKRRVVKNYIWVEDVTTGGVIAGEKPSDDKAKVKKSAAPRK